MSQHSPNIDPSIRACARALIVEAMEAIEADRVAGVQFYAARDRAVETRAADWVRLYGKDTADAAVRGLHMLQEGEILSQEAKATIQARRAQSARSYMLTMPDGRNSWINRTWLRMFGLPLYGLALAILAAGTVGGASPASAASGQHVAPQWRALAACGVAKPGSGRDRACRRFNGAERETWRAYDGPGAGAPRDWELPRSWEIPD